MARPSFCCSSLLPRIANGCGSWLFLWICQSTCLNSALVCKMKIAVYVMCIHVLNVSGKKKYNAFWNLRLKQKTFFLTWVYKTWDPNTNKTGSTILKEWTTPDFRNTPSTTNLEEEEIVDALGNDANASMPKQVNRPNPWRKSMMMI